MKAATAWALVALLAGATWASLNAPLEVALVLLIAAASALRRRLGFLATAALGLAANVLFFALFLPGEGPSIGPVTFSMAGSWTGLRGGLRLAAAVGVNLALLSRFSVARVIDGLRLPVSATAFLAAVLATTADLGRDFVRLRDALRLEGKWPRGTLARGVASARLLAPLTVLAIRHGSRRRDALRLAGHATAPRFAALVAVTALACAGRLALVAIPNDPLTYAAVFLGGLLFGPRTGAWAGALAMILTNLVLSGLYVPAFANVPAMALLGLLGGWLRPWHFRSEGRWTTSLTLGCVGVLGVLSFSIASDIGTWLLVPEFRTEPTALQALIVSGIAFNAVPALAAAVVFATGIGPVARAVDAARLT